MRFLADFFQCGLEILFFIRLFGPDRVEIPQHRVEFASQLAMLMRLLANPDDQAGDGIGGVGRFVGRRGAKRMSVGIHGG